MCISICFKYFLLKNGLIEFDIDRPAKIISYMIKAVLILFYHFRLVQKSQ
jgi:hypothetical protein